MSEPESASTDPEWTVEWIEKQRELLRQQASRAGAASGNPQADAVGAKWRELGDAWLDGFSTLSRSASADASRGAAIPPFKVGEEMLQAWNGAWTVFESGQQGITDTLAKFAAHLPPLGPAREHALAWRELATTQAECRRLESELRSVLLKVQHDALDALERRVHERAVGDQPVGSFRELYDLWVESAEQVYSAVAQSEAFAALQAQLGNATVRLRGHQQKVIEYILRHFDLPTRSELNSVHLQLRALKQQVAALSAGAPRPATRRKTTPARKSARAPRTGARR
jgi:class III poly(R)-hydroxyalkanoic acid synthase PhaE subunit